MGFQQTGFGAHRPWHGVLRWSLCNHVGGEGDPVSVTWVTLPSPPADFVAKDPALESDLGPPRLVLNHALTSSAKWKLRHHEWLRNETRGYCGSADCRSCPVWATGATRTPLRCWAKGRVWTEAGSWCQPRAAASSAGGPHPLGSGDAVRPAGISTTEIR